MPASRRAPRSRWFPGIDPVRNAWIVDFGLICCAAIIPLAVICGPIRGIPLFWTAVDCSFAPGAAIPLWIARRAIQRSA